MIWDNYKNIYRMIGSPKVFVYSVIWLMFLVVIGTLAQRDQGLYLAQQKYFSSWFTFIGFIPIPSGRFIMSIIFVNLSCYFFRPNILKVNKIGITIVHFGVIMLLAGGGLTAIFSSEGNVVIEEGQTADFVESFYLKEFAVINTSDNELDYFTVFDQPLLYAQSILRDESFPFEIKILEYYSNSDIETRLYRGDNTLKGMAKNFVLEKKKDEKEYEKNISGIVYQINNANEEVDGIYISFLGQPVIQTIQVNGVDYSLILRRHRTYLPFKLKLNNFNKEMHPGTNIAKSYSSDIFLIENNMQRKVLIQMNEPLRHKGYTFYQASFIDGDMIQTTVLAAVKNYGRIFPYVSTIIMCIGLLFHMLYKLYKRPKKVVV